MGLGVKDVKLFKKALIAKWKWRLGTDKLGFGRLYTNSHFKETKIGDVGTWKDNWCEWDIRWMREWFEWQSSLVTNMMHGVEWTILRKHNPNEWVWKDEDEQLYTIKFAYEKLQNFNRE